ncbi:MAG: DUF4416 family protein [Spirochaetes bacterium]|nr:DUF4416 family protein [Spirochaetota bacterium]
MISNGENMGTVHSFMPEKLVIGILIHDRNLIDRVLMEIENKFGGIDYKSESFLFTFSDYYNSEMGSPLYRSFVSIKKLYRPDDLSSIKIETNEIEEKLSISGKRRVNLDPGIMALSRFVLASTKESSHRIPLKSGIYGEITLMFEKKRFRPVEWTYPDYSSEQYVSILNKIRDIYKEQLK